MTFITNWWIFSNRSGTTIHEGELCTNSQQQGYTTTPTLADMATKSEADLAALAGFSISREGYGSVAWEGTVDVRGINLDSIISIEHNGVAVYDDQDADGTKPAVGEAE
jgi:nuclear pore complex protein Nup98-Nup96